MFDKLKKRIRKISFLFNVIIFLSRLKRCLFYLLKFNNRYFNKAKCLISALLKKEISYGSPIVLNIEPINICDQKCIVCETGLGILNRKPRKMTFEEFKFILDQFDNNLQIIYFYFMGESFLNKDSYRMIRYAADKGIYVSACTNGNQIDAEQLVLSGIADIQFQISGTTQETHEAYRVGGKLKNVIENIRKTIELRNKYSKILIENPYPMKIGLGLIVMKTNEHQINDFFNLGKKLGVDKTEIILPCVRTVEQGKKLLPENKSYWIYDVEMFKKGILKPKNSPNNYCEWIYSTVTIQVNGDVVPCCRDPHGKWVLGNVFKQNIYEIWNGKKYKKLRKIIATNQKNFELCALCEGYSLPELNINE